MIARLFFFFFCLVAVGVAHGALPEDDFLVIRYQAQKKEAAGKAIQRFTLVYQGLETDSFAVYYQQFGDPNLYTPEREDGQFVIAADSSSFFRLIAIGRAKDSGILHIAQTDFCLFGNAKEKVRRHRVSFSEKKPPFFPFQCEAPKNNYWPQTGQAFVFQLHLPQPPERMELAVWANNLLSALHPDEQLRFNYTPEHDPRLRETGTGASRQDIFLGKVTKGDEQIRISYTLLLHRSRTAFLSPGPGVALFLLSVLFFGGWVRLKRKGGPW